ncbi:MAG: indole-3-glycerol phosphate synthase TrpC [bacterium]|jgi:indole-3-glycerol phosphate synthase
MDNLGKPKEDVLVRIVRDRRKDIAAAKRSVAVNELYCLIEQRVDYRSLSKVLLHSPAPRIIAEVKKASPSSGLLRPSFDPAALAQAYVSGGAVAVSVLTEPNYFMGSQADLKAVRRCVTVPVLRKDFMVDIYQLIEAAAWGADVILLIVAALSSPQLKILYKESRELGLEAIVEVHTAEELKVALTCDEAIIGVNSRNLKTLKTDLAVAYEFAKMMPKERICIAESGIKTKDDIRGLQDAGYKGFLIGESLLRETFPGKALKALRTPG